MLKIVQVLKFCRVVYSSDSRQILPSTGTHSGPSPRLLVGE